MSQAVDVAGRAALVTGAAGFIGANLVRALLNARCRVAIVVRPRTDLWRLTEVLPRVSVVTWDLMAEAPWAELDLSCASDLVFHLAAAGTTHAAQELPVLVEANLKPALHVMELAQRARAQRVVSVGSCLEYGSGVRVAEHAPLLPTSSYGIAKAVTWMAMRAAALSEGLSAVSLRLFSPFGSFEDPRRLVPHVIRSASEGRPVTLTAGQQTRDFVLIDDVIEALLRSAVVPHLDGEVINICTGRQTRVIDFVTMLLQLMGDPVPPAIGALPYRAQEPMQISGDPTKAASRLGWQARTPLEEGLQRTIAWWRQREPLAPVRQSGWDR